MCLALHRNLWIVCFKYSNCHTTSFPLFPTDHFPSATYNGDAPTGATAGTGAAAAAAAAVAIAPPAAAAATAAARIAGATVNRRRRERYCSPTGHGRYCSPSGSSSASSDVFQAVGSPAEAAEVNYGGSGSYFCLFCFCCFMEAHRCGYSTAASMCGGARSP